MVGRGGGKVWHEGRVEEAGGANLIVFVSKGGVPVAHDYYVIVP